MTIDYVLINKENRDQFLCVFPAFLKANGNRVSLGAVNEDGEILGGISFTFANFRYDIDWLYVEEAARRQGVGAGLVRQVIKFANNTGEIYPIACRFDVSDTDKELHSFFISLDEMEVDYSHERYFITTKDVVASKLTKMEPKKGSVGAEAFFDKPKGFQENVLRFLEKNHDYSVFDYEEWKDECVPELCKCVISHNELVGSIFILQTGENKFDISFVYSRNPKALALLLGSVAKELEEKYPDAELSYETVSSESEVLSEHLFSHARSEHIYEAVY